MSASTDKGGIAELAIMRAAAELGVVVSRPMVEGRRYDVIFDTGPLLLRVQCKWAVRDGNVIRGRLSTSRHTPRNGYVITTYSADEIDAVALFCAELDRCFLLPIAEVAGQTYVHLRLAPAQQPADRREARCRLRPR